MGEGVYQFSSVAQSCPTLCDPMNRSTPGLPVHHQLPEFTQTQVHQVSDAIQPSHPLLSPHPTISSSVVPFSSRFQSSQHQGLFKWVSSLHQVAKVLEFQLQYQSFRWIFRTIYLSIAFLTNTSFMPVLWIWSSFLKIWFVTTVLCTLTLTYYLSYMLWNFSLNLSLMFDLSLQCFSVWKLYIFMQ